MKIRCWVVMTALGLWLGAGERTFAATEALNWNTRGQPNITCIYGEITVLASIPSIYFCGAQWDGVGGYCGIQHNSPTERRTIFSIWDTAPTLRPRVTAADKETVFNRFGGEGEGAHTHMIWNWKYGETFRFFLQKRPGATPSTTDTRYYIFDPARQWRHSATINSPNGDKNRGTTFDGVVSWIENFGDFQATAATPKIALYSLWVGDSVDGLKHLTRSGGASGSGRWGQLRSAYFLAEGSPEQLAKAFAKLEPQYGQPIFGVDGKELPPIPAKPLPAELIKELKRLPNATATLNPDGNNP
jgi:hypothetical protein